MYPPGAECAAVGADVVERGLGGVSLLLPLPLVDDELPLEVGQELQVLLLLGHTHHLQGVSLLLRHDENNIPRSRSRSQDITQYPEIVNQSNWEVPV